jgi:hypothetical protein
MNRAIEILYPITTGMAFLWLALVFWLYHSLRTRHVSIYERIGRPDIFSLVIGFVLTPKWQQLNEPPIGIAVRLMRVYFICCLLLFVALFVI